MHPIVAQIQMQYDDAIDIACRTLRSAETTSQWMGLASLPVIAFALWYRARAASEAQNGVWAVIALLAGVTEVLVAMWQVPMGCLSWHALSSFVAWSLPWVITAGLFWSAVPPTPDALKSSEPAQKDPFA